MNFCLLEIKQLSQKNRLQKHLIVIRPNWTQKLICLIYFVWEDSLKFQMSKFAGNWYKFVTITNLKI